MVPSRSITKCAQVPGRSPSSASGASEANVFHADEKELGVALVDLGGGTTDVLVFQQGALKHTAVLSLGGNHVTNDIAAGLRTPFRDAEILKQRHGCALARLADRDQSIEVPSVGGRTP